MGVLTAGAGCITDQPVVGFNPDEHRIAFGDGPFTAVERQPYGFWKRKGQEVGSDAGDLHSEDSSIALVRDRHGMRRSRSCPSPFYRPRYETSAISSRSFSRSRSSAMLR